MTIDPDLAQAALAVAEWVLMKRNDHPLYCHESYKRAVAHFEEVQTRLMIENVERLRNQLRDESGPSVPFDFE